MARLTLLYAALAVASAGCAALEPTAGQRAGAAGSDPVIQTPGSIVEVATGAGLGESDLIDRLARADFVLLGETHDNPEHHEAQAAIVAALQARSEHPRTVAFEMIGTDQQIDVVEHFQARPGDVEGLAETLAWETSGWPEWWMYAPIVDAAVQADAPVVGANLPRADVLGVAQLGPEAAVRGPVMERTGLSDPLPVALATDLRIELEASHCGIELPPGMIDGMFRVQRTRDAIMADRLVATAGAGGGILIAGKGHVRLDRGVPWYVARMEPEAEIASVAFLEITESRARDLANLPFTYVWFTEPAEREDPCEGLAEHFESRSRTAGEG